MAPKANGRTVISRKLLPLLMERANVKMDGASWTIYVRADEYFFNERDHIMNIPAQDFNYFCYNKQNKITCWPMSKGDQPLNEKGQWVKEGRQEMKAGRFFLLFTDYMRVIDEYGYSVTDPVKREKIIARGAEAFATRVIGSNEELNYSLSTDVSSIYKMKTNELSHYLANSCMRKESGHGCSSYSGFYNTVPELQILYKTMGDTLFFRSLLWKAQVTYPQSDVPPQVMFLDRIYGTEVVNSTLIELAKENDWAWRRFGDNRIRYRDREIALKVDLPINSLRYLERYGGPYVDTLYNLYRDRSKGVNEGYYLSNVSTNDMFIARIQECSGGSFNIFPKCAHCGKILNFETQAIVQDEHNDEDNVFYHKKCYEQITSVCKICGRRDFHSEMAPTYNRETKEIDNICSDCRYQDKIIYHCSDCGTFYYFDQGYHYDAYMDRYFCEECVTHWTICPCCGEPRHRSAFRNRSVDGKRVFKYCERCVDKITTRCFGCGNRLSGSIPGLEVFCPNCTRSISSYRVPNPSEAIPLEDVIYPVGWLMENQMRIPGMEGSHSCGCDVNCTGCTDGSHECHRATKTATKRKATVRAIEPQGIMFSGQWYIMEEEEN